MAEELARVAIGQDGPGRVTWLMFGAAPEGVGRETYEAQARARFRARFGVEPRETWWWSERWLYVGPAPEDGRG